MGRATLSLRGAEPVLLTLLRARARARPVQQDLPKDALHCARVLRPY